LKIQAASGVCAASGIVILRGEVRISSAPQRRQAKIVSSTSVVMGRRQ
jgi:hypothetical protein